MFRAYALNRQFAASIVTEPWTNIPFDDLLRQKCEKSYALSPMIAFQSTASSDNRTVYLDKMRLVSIAVNLLPMRYYFVKLKYELTGRGVLFVTFIYIIVYFWIH